MRSDGGYIAAGITLALVLLAPGLARAADADTERARALFDEAGELERHGQWGAAEDRLRAALRLRETPHLHYALGWALENADKLLEAKSEYETAARLGREQPSGEEASRLATARLADLEKKVAVVRVRVRGGARSQARVLVDGRPVGREDNLATTSVNPGSHVIRVERGARPAFEQVVYVGRSSVRTVDVAADEPVVGSAPRRRDRGATSRAPAQAARGGDVMPWLLLSFGGASVAGGGALLVSGEADETVGLALAGAGLVAGTIGAVLVLRGDDAGDKDRARARGRAGAAPLPGGGIATATFTF
ncbi:MAG: hypothetical protein KF764_14755 [Labilithrix sp.]|nr:hypothetical protein [Labilithrix sp.]